MKFYKLFTFVLSLCIVLGCTEKETQVEVSSVSLNTSTIEMVEGETFSLVATVLPKDAEYDGVIWASSNASVARVNSGTVTALKEGTATITASAGGKSSTCTVKVSTKVVSVTSITLDKTSLSMKVGETETITATVNPDNATDKSVTWGSSDVSVATVADGRVTAKKSGTAIITAKSGSCVAECTVTISVDVESVTLDKTTLSLAVGEAAQLAATVKPDDATDKNVSWTSSDASVAKVDNGKVTAVKSGKATITAKCGGKTAECAVTVAVPVSSITLDKTTLSLAVGESAILTATVKPDDATDKTVTWSSSDEPVVKVDNGKVTALTTGQARITAVIGNITASCDITVYQSDNVIIYTTTDKKVLTPYNEDAFGSAIVSNTYVGDVGIITFEKPVTFIGNMAFYQQSKLQSIVIPNTVSTIGKKSFESCKGLLSVKLPHSLTSIDAYAFQSCSSMKALMFPDNVLEIGENAFVLCENAFENNTLVLPKKLQTISSYAFQHCKLRSVIWNEDLNYIGASAFGSNDFEEISIPGCLKSSGFLSFSSCELLKKVELQEGVTIVGDRCFVGCEKLSKVILPSTLTRLIDPFDGCYLLKDVYVKAIVPPVLDSYQFRDADLNQLSIWVPRESVDAYKKSGWLRYKDNIKAYDY